MTNPRRFSNDRQEDIAWPEDLAAREAEVAGLDRPGETFALPQSFRREPFYLSLLGIIGALIAAFGLVAGWAALSAAGWLP